MRELAARDLPQVHLVGTVDEVQRARVRVHRGERPVVGDAGAAEQLDRAVDHGRSPTRAATTLIAAISNRAPFVADGVHQPRGLHREQARLLDLDATLGDAVLHDALVGERLAERDALLRARAHELERPLRQADRAHAVVDAPGPRRACAIAKPPPSSPSRFSAGTRTFSNSVSQ